jgi:hypothetical protein
VIAFELRDLAAAADLIEALRGNAPETDADARRRERLADLLDDALAEADAWAVSRGIQREPHPADWDSCAWDCPTEPHRRLKRPGDTAHPGMLPDYCPSAGPRRNALMVGLGAELCIAAPVGRSLGTRNCMRLAKAAGIRVDSLDGWAAA